MGELIPLKTLDAQHSAHCGVCWFPAFALWVDRAPPDYTRCPLGDYTAQTCPNARAEAAHAALLAQHQGESHER